MSPVAPGGAPRLASGSDPDSFQIVASVLELTTDEILFVSFMNLWTQGSGEAGQIDRITLKHTLHKIRYLMEIYCEIQGAPWDFTGGSDG